jgi:PAS domain S-box-containing protein
MSSSSIRLDEYLGQAFHRMPVAMIVVDQQGLITRLNRLAETTFGYDPGELIGQAVERLVPERLRAAHPAVRQGFQSESQARPMGLGRELSALRKDGSEFPVEIGINPAETGEGMLILTVILDLSERKLAEQRTQEALAQKDLLLREVHHRVKNNLQVIHSLLDLQALNLHDQRLVAVLRDSQDRIRSMSLIHQTLYQSHDLARVDFQRFLDELLPQLGESYRSVAGAVQLQAHAQNVTLPIDEAIPCGLVVNELVSNALKHGFAQGRGGRIEVSISQGESRGIELSVANDGHAIADEQALQNPASLGLQLVRLLTRQLKGSLDIRLADPTRFTLRFPRELEA